MTDWILSATTLTLAIACLWLTVRVNRLEDRVLDLENSL